MKYRTTTITLSIPVERRTFFDELAANGYNRSYLMMKMAHVLEVIYRQHDTYPGGLPKALDRLRELVKHDLGRPGDIPVWQGREQNR